MFKLGTDLCVAPPPMVTVYDARGLTLATKNTTRVKRSTVHSESRGESERDKN